MMKDEKQTQPEMNKPAPLKAVLTNRTFVSFVCFVLINVVAFQLLYQSKQHTDPDQLVVKTLKDAKGRTFSWWTASAYEKEQTPPDIVLIGSSQMGSATFASDAQVLQQKLDVLKHRHTTSMEMSLKKAIGRDYGVFNCSQGGFMVSDAYMMSRALFSGARKPKVAIIGISPRDFMDNSMNSAAMTEPFQFYAHCVDPGRLYNRCFADAFSRLQWLVSNELPLRWFQPYSPGQTEDKPGDAAAAADKKHGRSQLMLALSDTSGDLKPGVLLIPANISLGLTDNTNEYEHRYHDANPPVYKNERIFFKELLAYLKQSNIKVIVVGMPSLWPTRELLPDSFWQDFRAYVAQTCNEEGARWIDKMDSPEFNANDFLDTVHLNALGGRKLFDMLAAAVAGDEQVMAALEKPGGAGRAIAGTRLAPQAH